METVNVSGLVCACDCVCVTDRLTAEPGWLLNDHYSSSFLFTPGTDEECGCRQMKREHKTEMSWEVPMSGDV